MHFFGSLTNIVQAAATNIHWNSIVKCHSVWYIYIYIYTSDLLCVCSSVLYHFEAKRRMAFCLMSWPASAVVWYSLFIHYKVSSFYISRTVWSRFTKFYACVHTGMVYSHTGYDITCYLHSKVIAKTCRECRLRWLQVELFQNGLSEDYRILHTYRRQSASQICRIWLHYPHLVGYKMQFNTT